MLDFVESLAAVKLALFGVILLSAWIYSAPILLIRNFRTSINLLTVNLCVSATVCSIYWILFCTLQVKSLDNAPGWYCVLLRYFQTFANGQEIYSLCVISINRFCFIRFPQKPWFKTRQWSYMCVASQWLLGVILPLPTFALPAQVRLCTIENL